MSDFARHRFVWLDALARDQRVTTSAFRLAYVISGFVNRKTGDAWPGQQRLAREIGTSVRTVQRDAGLLARCGHLTITGKKGGRGVTNRYVPSLAATAQGEIFPQKESKSNASRPPRRTRIDANEFDAFWDAYPRKIDRAAAHKAYAAVLRAGKAVPRELIEGAKCYAHERSGQDPKYTKHPKTWLNSESWKNEPAAQGPAETGAMSAVRGILRGH